MNKINILKYIIRNKFNNGLFVIISIFAILITIIEKDMSQFLGMLILIVFFYVVLIIVGYLDLKNSIIFIKPPLSHLKSKYVSLENDLEEKHLFGNEKDIEQIKIAQEQYEKAIDVLKNANL